MLMRRDVMLREYGIEASPTNYLIDGQGKIVWRYVGYSLEGLRELRSMLSRLGVP
jgi:hypothetical protein